MMQKIIRFLIPKLFVSMSIVAAFLIGNATFKEMDRGKRIQEEIASLQAESQKTQKENALLREKIRYFQTDTFQAQEAHDKLNYQSPDEKVVVVKMGAHEAPASTEQEALSAPKAQDFLPNYEKWWNEFFSA